MRIGRWLPALAVLFATLVVTSTLSPAQSLPAQARIAAPVEDKVLTTLKGNVHPLAQARYDVGAASGDLPMQRMLLVLKRSPEQQRTLSKLMTDQQDKASPQYHKWLTPVQFGSQFGPADQDIQTITNWLQSYGFEVASVAKGRTMIEFSGTAAQVQAAFHTAIHKFSVNGEAHWANAQNPQIPSALTPAVAGVMTLHNFLKKPQSHILPQEFSAKVVQGRPQLTLSDGRHFLAPADYATIYDITGVHQQGITGSGVTIGVVSRSNIDAQNDAYQFHYEFSDGASYPSVILNGPDPGLVAGDQGEATLDTEWSGAVAPGATINLVVSASTNDTDGVDLSELYIVDNNLADVMTESYGSCELAYSSTEAAGIFALAEQAAAQGITYLVSTGDSGSAGCDDPNTETAAMYPVSVNILASTPFNIAVGGSMFNDVANPGTYWSTTNVSGTGESAKSYIPEVVWNESCVTNCGSLGANILAGGGGVSIFSSAKPVWQSGVSGIPADSARDLPDVSLTAAGHDPYLVCFHQGCIPDANNLIHFFGFYGTSASAPSFAGIMALVNQKTGARQGQANYVLYRLGSDHTVFHDITTGNNDVPGETGYGTSTPLYAAKAGYDLATGLGSVDVFSLLNKWSTITFSATTTTLTLTPTTSIVHGQPVTVGITVAPTSATGVPTGDVSLITSGGTGADGYTLANGAVTGVSTRALPGGNFDVTAHYAGDATFAPSDSSPVNVIITPEPSTTTLAFYNQSSRTVPVTSSTYGNFLYVRADVAGNSGQGYATGVMTFSDTLGSVQGGSILNSIGNTAFNANGNYDFPGGVHTITAAYSGDVSFANSMATSNLTIVPATTAAAVTLSASNVGQGANLTLSSTVTTSSAGAGPSGTISFFSGSTLLGTIAATGTAGSINTQTGALIGAQATASFSTSSLALGPNSVTVQYGGDQNYSPSTSTAASVNVVPDFSLATNPTSPLVIAKGSSGTLMLTVTGGVGYNANITFSAASCTQLPAEASCSFSPATVSGSNQTTLTLTTKAAKAAALPISHDYAALYLWSTLGAAGMLLLGVPSKRARKGALLSTVFVLALAWSSCGGGGGSKGGGGVSDPGTPVGSYVVTVTGTADSGLVHTTTFNLTVQ